MTWGGDALQDIPNGTTWNGWVTGREWEVAGTGLDLWTGGVEFHLYYDLYPWTTPSWTEVTPTIQMQSFTTNRGVKSWWEGARAGSATIVCVNDAEITDRTTGIGPNSKMKLTVETSSGEHDLFTGWVFDLRSRFGPDSATITIQLIDGVGYTGQQAVTANTGSSAQASTIMRSLLSTFGNGIAAAADYAGIAASSGLTNSNVYSAGNLMDLMNAHVKGDLGLLWVDPSGIWQARFRNWWYPQPNAAATIGSLDRNASGDRADPTDDTGWKFPAQETSWSRPLGYNYFTWSGPFTGSPFSSYNTASQSGLRKRTDAVYLTSSTDVANNLNYLKGVEGGDDIVDSEGAVMFPADLSYAATEYAAVADIGDFVEVAKETSLVTFRRQWQYAWVLGVSHSFDVGRGWYTTLIVNPNLAAYDFPVGE